jgi:hypothetical protein
MGCAAGAMLAVGAALRRADEPWLRRLLFLGPVWYAVSTAALHGVYFDPRHHALPLAGLALCSGFAFDAVLRRLRPAWRRPLACVALGAASLAFLPPSQRASREWERASETTARVRADVERITRRLPDGGAVMLVNTPQAGGPPYWFGWGLQSALRRPFTPSDVSRRLHVVDWRNREMNRDTSALPRHFDMRIQFSAERPGEIESIWRRPSAGRPGLREGAMLPRSRP